MYKLTLTAGERQAFDHAGGRYVTGFDVSTILRDCMGPDDEWSQEGDITFLVPEFEAWHIAELAELEDGCWPGFDRDLRAKMQAFCDQIV